MADLLSWSVLAMDLAKGFLKQAGAELLSRIFKPHGRHPNPPNLAQITESVKIVIQQALDQQTLDNLQGELNGVTDFMTVQYPNIGGSPDKKDDILQGYNQIMTVQVMPTLMSDRFKFIALPAFTVAAGMHLQILQECASLLNMEGRYVIESDQAIIYAAHLEETMNQLLEHRQSSVTEAQLKEAYQLDSLHQLYKTWREGSGLSSGSLQPDVRFRGVNDWIARHGYAAGFPVFNDWHQPGKGWVQEVIVFQHGNTDYQEVFATELGDMNLANPDHWEQLFRNVNDWARRRTYVSGFPNFHQTNHGPGVVYGVMLIKSETAIVRDAPVAELNFRPVRFDQRFPLINEWAFLHSYVSGFPNFHQADHGSGLVYGAVVLTPGKAEKIVVPAWQIARKK